MPQIKNIEIKAHCQDPNKIRDILNKLGASFKGSDHQIDTYFLNVNGRLKLREGNIENNLIHYLRDNHYGPKKSDCTLFSTSPDSGIKEILTKALGILTVVDKKREIFFIDHVKFHLDEVKELGSFVEIEVIDKRLQLSETEMEKTCNHYLNLLGITRNDLIHNSYSDLLLEKNKSDSQLV